MRTSVNPGVRGVNNRMTSVTTLLFPHHLQYVFLVQVTPGVLIFVQNCTIIIIHAIFTSFKRILHINNLCFNFCVFDYDVRVTRVTRVVNRTARVISVVLDPRDTTDLRSTLQV